MVAFSGDRLSGCHHQSQIPVGGEHPACGLPQHTKPWHLSLYSALLSPALCQGIPGFGQWEAAAGDGRREAGVSPWLPSCPGLQFGQGLPTPPSVATLW